MPTLLTLDDTRSQVEIDARRPELRCTVDDVAYSVTEAGARGDDCVLLTVGERSYRVWRTLEGNRIHLRLGGRSFTVGYEDPVTAAAHAGYAGNEVRAEIPGVVVDVRCTAQTAVAAGEPLLTIESMKMQITVAAPRAGFIEAVHVAKNQTFQKGAVLISFVSQDSPGA